LAWRIEFLPASEKELAKLGRAEAKRITQTLKTRIAPLDDPRKLGSALGGELGGLWRWRIDDPSTGSGRAYRVIARIQDERITILEVRVAHRRQVYR
jgi:mRNA interferase RelE/StbE